MPPLLTRSILFLFLAEFSFYVSGYLVQMGAGRLLGPADYGRYSLVITLTLLIANLVGNGIPIAMSKFLSENLKRSPEAIPAIKKTSAWLQFIFMGAVTACFFFLSPFLASILGDPSLTPLFAISSFIIPCYAADAYYFYYFSGTQRFTVQSFLKFIRSLMRIFIILGLAFLFGLSGIVAGYIFVPVAVFLLAWGIDFSSPEKLRKESSLPTAFSTKVLIRLALPITLFLILFEIFMSFDIYLLKYFLKDDTMAGLYSAALTVARIPTYLFYALTLILLPLTAEARTPADEVRTQKLLQNAFRFMFFLSWPFLIFSAAYSESLIRIFFGAKFLSAAPLLPSLALGTTLLAILYVLSFAYKGRGLIRIPLVFLGVGILLNFIFDFFLLPSWGLSGIALAKALTALILFPFFLYSLAQAFRVSLSFFSFIKVSFLSVLLFFLARFGGDSILALFTWGTLLFLSYFALLFFFKEITPFDLQILKETFSKKKTSTPEVEVSLQK